MIQRIQTVYLLIALILLSLNFFIPYFGVYAGEGVETSINGIRVTCGQCEESFLEELQVPVMPILNTIVMGLIIFQIISFKNRPKQIQFGYGAISVLGIKVLILAYTLFRISNFISGDVEFGYFFGIPTLAGVMVLIIMANYRISKDEEMVRSTHRLR